MKRFVGVFFVLAVFGGARADDLQDAKKLYEVTQIACAGIADELSRISGVSVANTVIGGVGTVAAGGAVAVGLAKENIDREIENLVQQMCIHGGCDTNSIDAMSDEQLLKVVGNLADMQKLLEQKTDQSKKLGNWRTGLMAGTIGTNVATAIVSGLNRDQSELIQQITACNAAVAQLAPYKSRLIAAGVNPMENPIVNKIDNISTWCRPINVMDVEKIEKRMTATMGTGIAGAVIGVAGTATSAFANSDKVRDDDTDDGKQKEKKLNTASNVLAGANVATGAVETGLSISLISLSKKLIQQAELCQGAF